MSTTIDAAGRIVVPKAVREAMGLRPGTLIDIVYADGAIRIEFAPNDAVVDASESLPRIVPSRAPRTLSDEAVRATLESTRR